MATREVPNEVVRYLLSVGDSIQANYDATAYITEITEASTVAGKLARSIGDRLDTRPTVQYHQDNRGRAERPGIIGWIRLFPNVVDSTLEWLEHNGQMNADKREQVLRGLYNLTVLANQAHLFAIMELAHTCLTTDEDPFPGQRQYIVQCLEDVKAQQEKIGGLVERASDILGEIVKHEGVDYLKGREFDNVVREAQVQIESCKRRLAGGEDAICELSQKMNTVKWASRGLRATGWLSSAYFFYKRYQESNQSSIDLLKLCGFVAVSGWICMSLLPGRQSAYFESLSKLEADHHVLKEKLEDLHVSIKSAKDHRDGL